MGNDYQCRRGDVATRTTSQKALLMSVNCHEQECRPPKGDYRVMLVGLSAEEENSRRWMVFEIRPQYCGFGIEIGEV